MTQHLILFDPKIEHVYRSEIEKSVQRLLKMQNFEIVPPDKLPAIIKNREVQSLINPYGSGFPLQHWNSFLTFLENGGNWMNIGGKALRRPLTQSGIDVNERNSYHRELGIYQYPLVKGNRFDAYSHNPRFPDLKKYTNNLPFSDIHEIYYTLVNDLDRTKLDVFTHPTGETDYMIMARGEGGRPLAAAVFLWDHLWGRLNGSRWLLVNWEMTSDLWKSDSFNGLLSYLAKILIQGAGTMKIRPVLASYYPNERPTLKIYARNAGINNKGTIKISGELRKDDVTVTTFDDNLAFCRTADEKYVSIDKNLTPGFYNCLTKLNFSDGSTQQLRTGFWCYDQKVLTQPVKLGVGKDYISFNDKPYPVVGTSYMASDNHRWTFIDPNPAVWMEDFAEIKSTGINMIRSGLWFGEEWLQPNYGYGGEVTLRAFDAFVQTAAYFKMPLILTLMAFAPGSGAGHSPWFDPASILWQKELIGQFVRRFKHVPWIIWDLINEPSMSDPDRLWIVRPCGDKYEHLAWQKWLSQKHKTIASLRKSWDMTENEIRNFDQVQLPKEQDFTDQNWTLDGIKQQKAIDYVLFIQDHFRAWLEDHVETIRDLGSDQLTSMGQTEHGVTKAPNPVCHADVVDFTAMHSWSMNDDVLWKILQSKTQGVPHLFGETGSFPQDDPNKEMRRTEENLGHLYERKYIYSFATRSAGTIHWIWNTASMNSGEKESAVGGRRGSGSEKDELLNLRLLAFFVKNNPDQFEEPEDEDICLITPLENIFAPRSPASLATQNALRTLYFDLKMPAFTVASTKTDKIGNPKLIILPSPRTLSKEAWKDILFKVKMGATLLLTGPVDYDEYWKHCPRLTEVGIRVEKNIEPVSRDEYISVDGKILHARFTHSIQDIADKAVLGESNLNQFCETKYHKGRIVFSAVPLELADDSHALQEFYKYGFLKAGSRRDMSEVESPEVLVRPLFSKNYVLYTVISESGQESKIQWIHLENDLKISLKIPGRRASVFILERKSGLLISAYLNGFLKVGDISVACPETTVVCALTSGNPKIMAGTGDGALEVRGIKVKKIDKKYVKITSDQMLQISIPGNMRCIPVSL